jgi:hypothetical protein
MRRVHTVHRARRPAVQLLTLLGAVAALMACERTTPPTLTAPSSRHMIVCEITDPECVPPPDPGPPPSVTPPPIPSADRAGLAIHGNGAELSLGPLLDLGVRLVRYDVDWGHAEQYGTASDTMTMNAFRRNSIEVLANLNFRWKWQAPPQVPEYTQYSQCNSPSSDVRLACVPNGPEFWNHFLPEWGAFVGRIIRATPSVRYWSPWNEPNDGAFFSAGQTEYNAMARALCDTVRAIRDVPGSTRTDLYCVGPDAGLNNDYTIRHSPRQLGFVESANTAAGFDVISVHAYNWNTEMKAMVTEVKNATGGKPVWVTETGIPDPSYRPPAADPEFQERDLADKVIDVRLGSNVDAIFYYDMQTNYAGLMNDYDATGFGPRRPAYYALKKLLSTSPGTWSAAYTRPAWGMCSGPSGSVACDYTANPVVLFAGELNEERWDCVLTARALQPWTPQGRAPAAGAVIMGYRGAGQYGRKQTDAHGNASWNARCNVENGLYFGNGENGWYFASGTPNYFDGITFDWRNGDKSQTRVFTVTR